MAIIREIFMQDLYDMRMLKSGLPENPVVIDIGANIGLFSMLILSHVPGARIIAFEPMPGNYTFYHSIQLFRRHDSVSPGEGGYGSDERRRFYLGVQVKAACLLQQAAFIHIIPLPPCY